MRGEIDRDCYCQAGYFDSREGGVCLDPGGISGKCQIWCGFCRHKWPTPEQFRKEYEAEVSDDHPA
jgi:hypothetical protein